MSNLQLNHANPHFNKDLHDRNTKKMTTTREDDFTHAVSLQVTIIGGQVEMICIHLGLYYEQDQSDTLVYITSL